MTAFRSRATRKLNDPILMDWALEHYRNAQNGDPQRRTAMEWTGSTA